MKKIDALGFSVLEVLLVLAVVSLVSLGGYFVYKNGQQDDSKSSSASRSTIDNTEQTDLQPFLKAYENAGFTVGDETEYGDPQISESQTEGYFIATLGSKNGPCCSYFYSKDDQRSWVYFKHTSDVWLCTEFKTSHEKAAFKGETCYDDSGSVSTIQ